jgi:hypothetical protein
MKRNGVSGARTQDGEFGEGEYVMKYVAATLLIAIAIGPASALDADVGGQAGGIGVGAGVSVGGDGASVQGGASADGIGGANVGGSVGTGNGSPSAGVGAGVNVDGVGGANVGGSVDTGTSSSAGGSTNSSGTSVGIGQGQGTRNAIVALPGALRPLVILPRNLGPSGERGFPLSPKIARKPGTPDEVVQVCQQAIFSAAKQLGAVGVQAASAGPVRRQRDGLTAPLSVRIDYGKQVRQAKVGCRLDAAGRVIGVT